MQDVDTRVGRNVVRPDVVGWRRERWDAESQLRPIELLPDWICEVLSPSNEQHDRLRKMDLYARAGVPHVCSQILPYICLRSTRYLRRAMCVLRAAATKT